jgi:hypothetical protein
MVSGSLLNPKAAVLALVYLIGVHQCPSAVLSSLCSFAAKEFVLIRVHWWFSDFALLPRRGVQFAGLLGGFGLKCEP